MGNMHLKLVTPTTEKRTVTPKRAKNADLRTREYLTAEEVEALMAAARQNRYGHRDATMILIAFRHGLPRFRGRGPSLGSGRFQSSRPARPQGQARHSQRAPAQRAGNARASPAATRERAQSVRVRKRAEARPLTTAGFARMIERAAIGGQSRAQGPPSHAPARLRLRPCERGARHAGRASLSRAQEHSAYGPIHRAGAGPVQEFLERLDRAPSGTLIVGTLGEQNTRGPCASRVTWTGQYTMIRTRKP